MFLFIIPFLKFLFSGFHLLFFHLFLFSIIFDVAYKKKFQAKISEKYETCKASPSFFRSSNETMNTLWEVASKRLKESYFENKNVKGFIAGLPWFNQIWGRDAGLIVSGAIDLGYFREARNSLETLIRFSREGEIPNVIHFDGRVEFGSLDATPLFLVSFAKYVKFITASIVIASIFYGYAAFGSIFDLKYDCIWSPHSLRNISALLKKEGNSHSQVLSGAMIWSFHSNMLPFANITHPLAFASAPDDREVHEAWQTFQKHPPDFVILDGYTEKSYYSILKAVSYTHLTLPTN